MFKKFLVVTTLITLIALGLMGTTVFAQSGDAVILCQATGAQANPYVKITVDEMALNGHLDHHPYDYVAPEWGCPAKPTPVP